MILSVSRRTDIPGLYSAWFLNRIEAGCVLTHNPMNPRQIRRVELNPQAVEAFVFWTKNPLPLLPALPRVEAVAPFYFQYTLNPYGPDIEPGLPDREARIQGMEQLSRQYGRQGVVWRYDPILLQDAWDEAAHCAAFSSLCGRLAGYTDTVTISFADVYRGNRFVRPIPRERMLSLGGRLATIAREHGLLPIACCEADLASVGLLPAHCIDSARITALTGRLVSRKKDAGQRPGCGCCASVDIGVYGTCTHGCLYCYAGSRARGLRNAVFHDSAGEALLSPDYFRKT